MINLGLISTLFFAKAGATTGAPGGGLSSTIIIFGAMFLIMYFIVIRPQRKEEKRKKEMLGALKKGDAVVTQGGIHGVITNVNQEKAIITLKIADGVKTDFNLTAVVLKKN